MTGLVIEGISKRFAGGAGIDRIELEVRAGERVSIVGPSGAGKTTLLRIIAGLERADAGSIRIEGKAVEGLAPSERGLAMVLQGQPPFPHLSVRGNLEFSLKSRGVPRDERRERVRDVAEGLGLSEFLNRRPWSLSGGEKQRVVLGRALAARASVTLLDEPFSGIDSERREGLLTDLTALHGELGGAWLLVTHDLSEAQGFGHRVAVMREGRLVQVDQPSRLYEQPSDAFVARFVGDPGMNLLRCRVEVSDGLVTLWGLVPGAGWELPPWMSATKVLEDRGSGEIDLGWRAEDISPVGPEHPAAGPGDVTLVGTLLRKRWRGPDYLAVARVGGHAVRFRLRGEEMTEGDRLPLRFRMVSAHGFDTESGLRVFGPGVESS